MNSYRNGESKVEPGRVDSTEDFRLGAARRRLAESADQSDAIEALREIAGNFLGSEEIVLFQVDDQTADIRTLWSFGIGPDCNLPQILGDVGLQRLVQGECHVEVPTSHGVGSAPGTKAFVPIRLENRTVAVLAILQLLPQKNGFDRPDMDLLALLSKEAGPALFGANLKTVTDEPEART